MDWLVIAEHAGTAVASGGSVFLAAWKGFSSRIEGLETRISKHENTFEAHRETYVRDKEHRRELDAVRDAERASRPDPLEDIRSDVANLQESIEKLKEKSARYVRSDTFAHFTKAQEDQWKEIARTLGKLEALFK